MFRTGLFRLFKISQKTQVGLCRPLTFAPIEHPASHGHNHRDICTCSANLKQLNTLPNDSDQQDTGQPAAGENSSQSQGKFINHNRKYRREKVVWKRAEDNNVDGLNDEDCIPHHVRANPDTFGTMRFGHSYLPPRSKLPQWDSQSQEFVLDLENQQEGNERVKSLNQLLDDHNHKVPDPEDDLVENIYSEPEADDMKFIPDQRITMAKLIVQVKDLVKGSKLNDALDLFTSNLKAGGFQYRVKDMNYLFHYLIAECGHVGYSQMAFKLFNLMKKRQLFVYPHTYTSLFNSLGNSKWNAEDNISKIKYLREVMFEKGHFPNLINYHAMIKAYGRCGDIKTAFSLVDEMYEKEDLHPNIETYNFLLQACINDKEDGFRYAVLTWKKMYLMRTYPDIYSYNLLLRAIRECSVKLPAGEESEYTNNKRINKNENVDQLALIPKVENEENIIQILDRSLDVIKYEEKVEHVRNSTKISINLKNPEVRLALLGGINVILANMEVDRIKPNLKTVTEFLQIMPLNEIQDIMTILDKYGIKPDIDFFNLVIKRLCRYPKYNAKKDISEILNIMAERDLYPNIMTWGVLSTGVRNLEMAKTFIQDMESASFRPNIIIMGSLMDGALNSFDPRFILYVMKVLKHLEINPDPRFLITIQKFYMIVRTGLLNKETGKEIRPYRLAQALEDQDFNHFWRIFQMQYEQWKKSTIVHEEPKDPWSKDYKSRYPSRKRIPKESRE